MTATSSGHVGTFAAEDSLPRLPVPSLTDTCTRFVDWCAPLLTSDELNTTKAAVAEFSAPGSPAHAVQHALVEYAADPSTHSWLDDFWRSRYLGRRDRIAVNANFFFLFDKPLHASDPCDQAGTAAAVIATAVAYQRALADETVPTSTQRGTRLSMEGNRHLFSTTRIPRHDIDVVRSPYTDEWPGPSRERHIVVLCRGAIFRLDVIGPEGAPHTLGELVDAVRAILAAAPRRGQSVGHLTTLARTAWAAARGMLLDADNGDTLDVLERALFCLSLDEAAPPTDDAACAHLLAGDSGTRWFDKTVSLIVFANGLVGVNGEHCCIDGTNMIELIDAMYATPAAEQSASSGARSQGPPRWTPLEFRLTYDLVELIDAAGRDFARYATDTAMLLRTYQGVGSSVVKRLGVSPDAFVQLAMQLAHRRARGFTGATYESVSTRTFHQGRTEAMRVVSPEVLAFVDALANDLCSPEQRRAAFEAAAAAHVARAKACQAGQAPEQHLWELQLLAARRGLDLPQGVYGSPGWRKLRDDYLSTSAVPSTNIRAFGFGATSQHCIGVAYVLLPDALTVYLATPRSVGEQMQTFADALTDAFTELQELLS